MLSKLVIASLVLAALPAGAQPTEHPVDGAAMPADPAGDPAASAAPELAPELSVDIAAPPGALDIPAVRLAIATELGVRIADPGTAGAALGTLAVTVERDVLRIAYRPVSGSSLERTLAVPPVPSDRVQLIAFVAANLVRDQVTALLAALARTPAAAPASTAGAPPAAPVVVLPPPAMPAPVPSDSTPHHWIPATIGLVPPLTLDRIAGAEVSVGVGVHGLVGSTDGSTIASVSGLVDVQRRFANGLQVGGVAAVTRGPVEGAQVGGVGTYAARVHGLQVGGVGTYAGRVDGAQVGGVAAASHATHGLQVGGVAAVTSAMRGIQVGGVAAVTNAMRGFQVGGVAAVAERANGVQIGGVATVGGDVHGLQVGVVNVAGKMHGVQLGVVNVSDDGDDAYPIGLFNFSRNGRVEVDGWVESTQLTGIALRHGPKHIHNIVAFARARDHDHVLAGLGIGLHHPLSEGARPLALDLDAINWWTDVWSGDLSQLDQLRVTLAVPVGPIDLLAGAAANVYISDTMDESANFHPVIARQLGDDNGVHVVSWPSVFAGVRMHAR